MNEIHYPTCKVWVTNADVSCDCSPKTSEWVIREDKTKRFPWRVFRCTSDGEQELMGCSTIGGAAELVASLAWLRENGRELWRKNNA